MYKTETYLFDLEESMFNLGEAFNYAINVYKLDPDEFMNYFINSGIDEMFEIGNPKFIFGMSGCELVLYIFDKIGYKYEFKEPQNSYLYSPEYWCGYILAYYQYKTGLSFKYIHNEISMKEILNMYYPLHEASEEKFVQVLNKRFKENKATRLQVLRKKLGLTQKELADRSGINLRILQEYEIGRKSINKASASTLYALSRVLNCKMEDLLDQKYFIND